MILPHHKGPECERCLRPTPTQAAWDELGAGEGEGLCWTEGDLCEDRRAAEIARLRAALSAAEENLARVRKVLSGLQRYTACSSFTTTAGARLRADSNGRAVLLADVLAAMEGA